MQISMARKKKPSEQPITATFNPKDARPKPFKGVAYLVLGIYALVSLVTYDASLNPVFRAPFDAATLPAPMVGIIGMRFAYHSLQIFGYVGWLLPLYAFWISGMYFFAQGHRLSIARWFSLLASLILLSTFGTMGEVNSLEIGQELIRSNNNFPHGPGGVIGDILYQDLLHRSIGMLGTLVIFGVLLVFLWIYLFYDNIGKIAFFWGRQMRKWYAEYHMRSLENALKKDRAERVSVPVKQIPAKSTKPVAPVVAAPEVKPAPVPSKAMPRTEPAVLPKNLPETSTDKEDSGSGKTRFPFLLRKDEAIEDDKVSNTSSLQAETVQAKVDPVVVAPKKKPVEELPVAGLKIIASEKTAKAENPLQERKGDYLFPTLKLLAETPLIKEENSAETHLETAEMLVRTLGEFGVKVSMGEVHAGPVITRYDIHPAAGVRVEKIVNLDRNLALGLKALSVRILAPVPGKGCVGVEVPNKNPQSVSLRDILESEAWVKSNAEIPIALGKEVSGKPLIADLTRMPHLLIAGSTGSGKTVCINSIIASLLYKLSPEDVRFVMVDPKIVEMQVFNALPHMLIPVVTDPKKVPGALKYLLNEMERRYQMFASIGVRNIAGFNAKRSKDKDAEAKALELEAELSPEERAAAAQASVSVPRDSSIENELPHKLPYIVCIVDELADLMMVAPADIETGIARLAQLARAAGIHLILATQRPSVNVITGIIKANLPSRIAFKVAAKVDSRTILDTMGADQLIGRGDMLFLPPGSADLIRSQGAFVSDDEISGIVDFIAKHNGEPEFDEIFQRSVEEAGSESDGADSDSGDWEDEMIPQAIDVLRNTKRASTSMLQRRLRIGYNRAARIMDYLEQEGYVGPDNGSMPREILKDLDS
jgi:S-DNA-T family DNA segregation ATPase FtsK/SpoIIIE